MIKKHLALIVLITSVSIATMAECGKLDLLHASKELLISTIVFFLVIFIGYYLFTTKYVEFAILSALVTSLGAIEILLAEEDANKEDENID
jgi:hypothetical protein